MTDTPTSNQGAEIINRTLIAELGPDIMDRPNRSLGDAVMQELANAGLGVINPDAEAEQLADQTMLGGISVDGNRVALNIVPPEEIAAHWLRFAQATLGDAANYAESVYELPPAANTHPELLQSITIPLHPTGEARERYTITVQRIGKLSPHEARTLAEDRALTAEARAEQLAAELAVFKAPPDFHNADYDATLLESWTEIITEYGTDPGRAARMLLQYARTAIWATEREMARWADMAQAAITSMEQMNAERQPATVYLVWGGEHDERDVRKVFMNKADADAYGCADNVEERKVEPGPVETRQWIRAVWTIIDPATPEHMFDTVNPLDFAALTSPVYDYDGKADALTEDWWLSHTGDGSWVVQFEAWERDLIIAAWKERRDRIVAASGNLPLPLDSDADQSDADPA